jgi:hypothetical protein
MFQKRLLLILLLTLSSTASFAASYDDDCGYLLNALLNQGYTKSVLNQVRKYDAAPAAHTLSAEDAPWAGNYMAMTDGGIANRWQDGGGAPARLLDQGPAGERLTQAQVRENARRMSAEEINLLSPAEKMDLYLRDYDFSITKTELKLRGPGRRPPPQGWEGFCNGMRVAGICLPEPRHAITVQNRDGVKITFQPADLKAISGASYFYVEKYSMIGSTNFARHADTDMPNAAAFDMALRAFIGVKHKAFVIDMDGGTHLWNVGVVGYERQILEIADLSASALRSGANGEGAVKRVRVQMDVKYLPEVSIPESNTITADGVADGTYTKFLHYIYDLFIDERGNIVEGKWVSDGPDMAWFGAGRGADRDHPAGNRFIDFDALAELFGKASRPVRAAGNNN